MIRKKLTFTCLLVVGSLFLTAQAVSTIAEHSSIRDGLHTDEEGNIYTTSGGLAGFTLGVYTKETGTFNPNFAHGFQGPVDVDVYRDSLFIATNYDNNTVSTYNPSTGVTEVIATGLDGPSGLVVDAESNVFVASWGGAPNYSGQWIHRIDGQTGEVRLLIDSDQLNRPQAMTMNHEGDLIIYGIKNLYKLKPGSETLEFWTDIGVKLGHMVYSHKDSCIYGTAIDLHKIAKIDIEGNLSFIAGNTAGYLDGDAADAKFNNPLGIEISPDENTLYISENGYGGGPGRLRSIDLQSIVTTEDKQSALSPLYPNPTRDLLFFENVERLDTEIALYDSQGQESKTYNSNDVSISMSLDDLPSGIYLAKITQKERVTTQIIYKN